jgi:uncharacterized protein DUF222
MNPNTHSIGPPDGLAALESAVDGLATQDLTGLADAVLAERVLVLRRLLDRLEGHWLKELAALDARGAAGADQGLEAPSTAGWLRSRLRMGATTASSCVRVARALFRGPLAGTASALTDGEVSPAHARVLAAGIQDLPAHTVAEAEPVLLEAARRLDPARLRQVITHLRLVADPTPPPPKPNASTPSGGCGWLPPWRAWSPSTGCWNPKPVSCCWRPWSRWPAPTPPPMPAAAASAAPTPWPSWPAAAWRPAGCPRPAGSAPS